VHETHGHSHEPGYVHDDDHVHDAPVATPPVRDDGRSVGRLYVLASAPERPFVRVLAAANDTVWYRVYRGHPEVTSQAGRASFSLRIAEPDAGETERVEIRRASVEEFLGLTPTPVYVEANLENDEWQATLAERFAELGTLSEEMAAQVEAIGASRATGIERSPCIATMLDGERVERVIVVEVVEAAAPWMLPASDAGPYGRAIDIRKVATLEDSPERLPADLASRVYMAGETAKDQFEFVIVLTDGSEVGCRTGAVVDYPGLPKDVTTADVADVRVLTRADSSGERRPTDFRYCYYRAE